MTEKILQGMAGKRILDRALARLPDDEVIPLPEPDEFIVFREYFSVRLCFPVQDLLEEILDAYNIDVHHLTPNGISKIALFIWAVKSQGVNPNIKAFCALHEMHTQFRNKPVDGKKVIQYFGYCSFKPTRNAKQIPTASKK